MLAVETAAGALVVMGSASAKTEVWVSSETSTFLIYEMGRCPVKCWVGPVCIPCSGETAFLPAPGCPPRHLLHDGFLGVLALDDAGLHEVPHGVITLAPSQDGEAGGGAGMLQPLPDAAKGLGERRKRGGEVKDWPEAISSCSPPTQAPQTPVPEGPKM